MLMNRLTTLTYVPDVPSDAEIVFYLVLLVLSIAGLCFFALCQPDD